MCSWQDTKKKIAGYYTGLIEKNGYDPRSCDYGRPESQQKKFKVLSEVIKNKHNNILDVGCGFADYAGYLAGIYPELRYTGIDITPEFVHQAKSRNVNLDIRLLDILQEAPGKFDVVTANGIFYLLGENAPEIMKKIIVRMFECTNDVLAFNSLSSWCEDMAEGEFYADPLITLEFCRSITPWVTLRHDYHSRDFTIYMFREQAG